MKHSKLLNLAIVLLSVVFIATAAAFAVLIYPYLKADASYHEITQNVVQDGFGEMAESLLQGNASMSNVSMSNASAAGLPINENGNGSEMQSSSQPEGSALSGNNAFTEAAGNAPAAALGSVNGLIDFAALKAVNPDCAAWLYACGGKISYPVPVTGDKEADYYLKHGADGQPLKAGSVFVGKGFKKPFEQFETILYGHNMRNGSMFHELMSYKNPKYFHRYPKFLVLREEGTATYDIFAIVVTNNDLLPLCKTYTKEDEEIYLQEVLAASIYDCGVPVSTDDEIVVMVTCEYTGTNYRLAVYGKKCAE